MAGRGLVFFSGRPIQGKLAFAKGVWKAFFVSVLLGLVGCGNAGKTTLVEGTVSYQDEPVHRGGIRFIPEDSNVSPTGGVIKDGKYSVRVPWGQMKVQINSAKEIGKRKLYDTPNSPEGPIMGESLPPKYNENTELSLDVQGARMDKDWELTK
jgi:hypothetical protein